MGRRFQVIIKSPHEQGAGLKTLVRRLNAIEKLYEAIGSAVLRPGAVRVSLPQDVKSLVTLEVVSAERTESLAIAVEQPILPVKYSGEFEEFHGDVDEVFRSSVRTASSRDTQGFRRLFPEKVDQVRVLGYFKELSQSKYGPPTILSGLDGDEDRLQFDVAHSDWADMAMPSLAPENARVRGMIRAASLGSNPAFKLFDGARTIPLRPDSDSVGSLATKLSKVVEVEGRAIYNAKGGIKYIDEIDSVNQFFYSTSRIQHRNQNINLKKSIEYEVYASIDAKGFTLFNSDLDTGGHSSSIQFAIEAAHEEFAMLWDEYGKEEDENLHSSGLKLKKQLLALVESEESPDV